MKSFYEANHAFTLTERIFFYVFVLIAIISGLTLLSRLNNRFLMTVPDYGGSFTEGIVGVPRFINPILALSDPDQDLVSLVFSGLLKATPEGTIIDDLSQEHTISDDGKTYSFTLREDAQFHDGKPVTTDDIAFTIERIQDPTVKSPKRTIWEGVVVKKIDSRRITFTLKQAYAPFIENFTLGILPRHIWKDIPSDQFSFSERNVEAVGSGPYAIKKVSRNSYGLPTFYNLRAFSDYSLGKPFVKDITLNF
jgi:peptide/nickel transport system substrate-binding protein